MGVYDYVLIEPDVVLPDYQINTPQNMFTWQTRAFPDRAFRLHCLSSDGNLYRAHHEYDGAGHTKSHGEKGVQEFIESLDGNNIRNKEEFDWYPVRYNGVLRITSQLSEDTHQYDISFENKQVSEIERIYENYY